MIRKACFITTLSRHFVLERSLIACHCSLTSPCLRQTSNLHNVRPFSRMTEPRNPSKLITFSILHVPSATRLLRHKKMPFRLFNLLISRPTFLSANPRKWQKRNRTSMPCLESKGLPRSSTHADRGGAHPFFNLRLTKDRNTPVPPPSLGATLRISSPCPRRLSLPRPSQPQ
ncbi:hypothetical protein GWK47_050560 [Chionoecetes opilio]|uniref:Uncharacterized protein n=1 Tax=Chionoecetes opilio TaxID=41210 RepID=A0A8J4Y9X2_CHIOP|nr:hypothetical protein GWK47_050560 [Chionoecetes opilio]